MSLSGRLLQITIIRANRFLSSCNSTVSPVHGTLTFLAMDFQVWSFCFFIVDHRLILPNWIRSLTNVSKSFWPMSLCPTRSFWTFSGTTTFVTRLKSLLLSWHWGCQGMMVGAFICCRCPSHLFCIFSLFTYSRGVWLIFSLAQPQSLHLLGAV